MSATRNEITGDVIASKVRGAKDMDAYRNNYDAIFGKKVDTDAGWSDIVDRNPPPDGECHD